MEPTVDVQFSLSGEQYFVMKLDYHVPTSWLAVSPDEDGRYKVWPFRFYSIKSGERRVVPESDPLVTRYAKAEGWPQRGGDKWRAEIAEARRRHEFAVGSLMRNVQWHEAELARLDALIAAHGGVDTNQVHGDES